jgi:membrane associated rhomboid family serine protease
MYAAVPFEIVHGVDLVTTQYFTIRGEHIPIVQAPGPSPIYWTLLTSMFMHASWMHIIGNMVYLLIFGDQIEDKLGHFKFLAFYLVAGVVAALAQILTAPNSVVPTVGASGAIAGVLGAYLMLYPRNAVRVLLFNSVVALPAYYVLGVWVLMQVLGHLGSTGAQAPGVAYMAHIGGFAVGFVVSLFIRRPSRRTSISYTSS